MRRLLLSALFAAALLTKTDPESAHEFSRLDTVASLVSRGTYQLDDSVFITTVDKIYRDGHFYSHQPPMLATLEAPVYWAIQLSGARFNHRGRRVATYSRSPPMAWRWHSLTFAPLRLLALVAAVLHWRWWRRRFSYFWCRGSSMAGGRAASSWQSRWCRCC